MMARVRACDLAFLCPCVQFCRFCMLRAGRRSGNASTRTRLGGPHMLEMLLRLHLQVAMCPIGAASLGSVLRIIVWLRRPPRPTLFEHPAR